MRALLLVFTLFAVHTTYAHRPKDPPHQTHALGDLKLESGEVIRDFSISYVTHGRSTPTRATPS